MGIPPTRQPRPLLEQFESDPHPLRLHTRRHHRPHRRHARPRRPAQAARRLTPDWTIVHVGGPAILTTAQLGLDLSDAQLQHSRAGLAEVGNLGSASILDVLRRTHGTPPDNRGPGLMLAYGPGFTTTALTGTWTA
ncbi:hypothetical protein ACFW1M_17520 [Streptomyces inhibens]|uniref:hypothetical protein n=1 Tax=Streptomyces inhibens TaxID=2293571 RepID=UPI00369FC8BA